jgi:hypothetical protein
VRDEAMKYQNASYAMDGMRMIGDFHRILRGPVAGINDTGHNVTWDGIKG